ncbi:MAG TPA: FkbM family methyltransferase [Herbaspirillum sp.]|jgi:FkbM family methyltransferase
MKNHLFRLANKLYQNCYPVYYPLYVAWKAISDRRERALFRRLIRPGMHIVDVGANIGIYTRFFSGLSGYTGHVHAFEPAPANFRRLQQNVGSIANVSLNHAAIGGHGGTIKLFISDELNVDHRTFDSGDGRLGIDVPLVSLDSYFSSGERVDLIKIDVQGFELSVLQGAARVLQENCDIKVLMEFWPYGLVKASVVPSDVIDFIQSLGFEIRTTGDPHHLFNSAALDPARIDDYCNLILTRRRDVQN